MDWYQVSFTARKSDRHKVVEDGSMHGGVINNVSFDSGLHVGYVQSIDFHRTRTMKVITLAGTVCKY
jgi:hypothetical protein